MFLMSAFERALGGFLTNRDTMRESTLTDNKEVPRMRKCLLVLAMALAANLTMIPGCGGSGNSAVGFSLAVLPLPITLTGGTSHSISIGTIATGGFNAPIAISFSGLPTGVSISPATLTITGRT